MLVVNHSVGILEPKTMPVCPSENVESRTCIRFSPFNIAPKVFLLNTQFSILMNRSVLE
jgi:hypothetical protein